MRNHLLLLTCALGISSVCVAQQLSPTVITSSGGIDKTNALSLEWTLGESAIATNSTGDAIYTEGFHQPVLKVLGIETQTESLLTSYDISVAPNPVSSLLSVHIRSALDGKVFFNLTDMAGKKLSFIEAKSTDSKDIDMSDLAPGIYFLNIKQSGGELIKTYKISKLQ